MMCRVVDGFGGKVRVMALLASGEKEVVDAALSSCSRLMINKWEDLEK